MKEKTLIKGSRLCPKDWRIAIVASQFNHFIVDSLQKGAEDMLVSSGFSLENLTVVQVPGAFELPLTVKKLAKNRSLDGIIALGAVIRGATPHFEYVSNAATSGLMTVSLESELPIAFGLLTTDTIEQAIERAGTKAGNKGAESAMVLMEMLNLLPQLEG